MPFYEFHCPKCDAKFDLMRSIVDRDKPAACPICGDKKTSRQLPHVLTNVKGGDSSGSCPSSGPT